MNLVALGEGGIQLLLDHLAGSEEEKVAQMVALFLKVTSDYYSHLVGDEHVRKSIENAIGQFLKFLLLSCKVCLILDAILRPLFEQGPSSEVANEILVQIGILKVKLIEVHNFNTYIFCDSLRIKSLFQ